jgi:hypothetical protein
MDIKRKIVKAVEWILIKQIPAWVLIVAIILWILL